MLEIKPTSISLGEVKNGETKQFTLEVTNHSAVEQEFHLRPSCGSCTTVYIEKESLEPGETLTATCEFTPNSTGKQLKTISLWNVREVVQKFTFSANVTT